MPAAIRCRATVACAGVCLFVMAARPAAAGWSREFAPRGIHPSADIQAVTVWNGDLVIGGSFLSAGGYLASGIARWDGERWHGFGDRISGVTCLAARGDTLLAAGSVRVDDGRAQGLGWWDGEAWRGFDPPLHGDVLALAVWRGDLVVGGRFTIGDRDSTAHLARWDGAAWRPLGGGLAGAGHTRVEALAVWRDDLVVGGVFARAGDAETSNLARWDGQAWSPCGAGPGADDVVTVLHPDGGTLYAAGQFDVVDGVATGRVAAWDGAAWRALTTPDAGLGDVEIRALESWRGDLYAAGTLQAAGPDSAYGIARWDGDRWRALPRDFVVRHRDKRYLSGAVNALGVHGGRLVAAGRMGEADGARVNGLALWDGAAWDPLVSGQGFDYGGGREVAVLDGRVTVTGPGGLDPTRWLRWRDGSWEELGEGAVAGQAGRLAVWLQTAVTSGGATWALGAVSDGGVTVWHLVRWEGRWTIASTALPAFTDVTPGTPLRQTCAERVIPCADGIMVAGRFGPPGDQPRDHAVLWDGSSWRGLGRLTDETVDAIDAACVVAGVPTLAWSREPRDAAPRFGVVTWDGGSWRTILAADGTGVEAMTPWRGNLVARLVRGTGWPDLQGSLEAWNGSAWESLPGDFSGHVAGLGRVHVLLPCGDDLVAVGEFRSVDGLACDHVAFLRDDRWWPLQGGTDGWIDRAVVTDSALWCFGAFVQAGGVPAGGVARWDGPLTSGVPRDELPRREPRPRPDPHARPDLPPPPAFDDPAGPFANGDFRAWMDGQPAGWTYTGGGRGRCEADSVPPVLLPGGGVRLTVADGSHCGHHLEGRFALEPGRIYRIGVRARLAHVASEPGRQPDGAARLYLTDWPRTPHGRGDGPLHTGFFLDLTDTVATWRELVLRASDRAAEGLVQIRVTGPGTVCDLFEVRCDTIRLGGRDMMAGLIDELEGHHVPPGDAAVDWAALRERYLARPIPLPDALPTDHPFWQLLAELEDPRIVVESGRSDVGSILTVTPPPPVPPALALDRDRLAAIKAELRDVRRIALSFVGWTADGICYRPLHRSWGGDEPPEDLGPATRGLLLDLRNYDPPGSHGMADLERRSLAAASWFTADPLAYALAARRRDGRFLPPDTLSIRPSSGPILDVPVVVLIGPGCRGYGAQLALMLAALPNVVLVGQPTGGTAGERRRHSLPTGQHVVYPAAELRTLDGQVVNDDHGLTPDVFVAPAVAGTPVFDRGLEVLRELIAR